MSAIVKASHLPAGRVHTVRARYDVAQTTDKNRRLWAAADCLDADSCNNLAVRTILRNRCRYVFGNNSRAKGMIQTLAKHTVGPSGPRLQMQLGKGTQARALASRIEASFALWAKEIKFARKLRICRIAKIISGEIFPRLVYNPRLRHPVKLDLQLIECDQVTNPAPAIENDDIDGIFLDMFGNPDQYRVLKTHPGSTFYRLPNPLDYDDLPADTIRHYFDQDRPGQHRGIPQLTPAAQLVEEGRRFRAAVVAAAETAADFAIGLESDAPADPEGAEGAEDGLAAMDTIELSRGLATILPKGFKLTQTEPKHPASNYKEFQRELLAEVARCLDMPLSFASLDANDANMSSMYVVGQPYENSILTEREEMEADIVEPVTDVWLGMAFNPMTEQPLARRRPAELPHCFFWPRVQNHADPSKVANARTMNLKNHSTTLAREYAAEGLDWEEQLEQRAREQEFMQELGLTIEQAAPPPPTGDPDDDEEDDEPDVPPARQAGRQAR